MGIGSDNEKDKNPGIFFITEYISYLPMSLGITFMNNVFSTGSNPKYGDWLI